jgi:hypothetical protein
MKTNLDQFFKTNEDLEKNGRWFEITGDIGFLVRPFKATNPKVKAAMAAHFKPYARQIELGTLDDKKSFEINVRLFIESCLVDWRGVEIDGQAVPFAPDVALKFFEGLPDLFHTLWAHCNDFKNYRDDVKNY